MDHAAKNRITPPGGWSMPQPPGCTCPDAGYVSPMGGCLRCHAPPPPLALADRPAPAPPPPAVAKAVPGDQEHKPRRTTVLPSRGDGATEGDGQKPRRIRKRRLRDLDGAERLDVRQVESLLGYSRRSVERWILDRGFPRPHYVRRSRKRIWVAAEVRAWLAANELVRPGGNDEHP